MLNTIAEHLSQVPSIRFVSKETAQELPISEVKNILAQAFIAISGLRDCPSLEAYVKRERPFVLAVTTEKVRTRIYLVPLFNGVACTSNKCEFTFEVEHRVVLA